MKIILNIFIVFNTIIYCQEVEFFQEDITFTLDNNYFKVDGFYWFVNQSNGDLEKMIFFPFGTNSSIEKIDSIEIVNVFNNYNQKIIHQNANGIQFLINVSAFDTVIYRIKYTQKILSDSAKYILTSTREWNNFLIKAVYKLIVSNDIYIKEFSYKPFKQYNFANKNIYYWEYEKFMPEKDMIIKFTK